MMADDFIHSFIFAHQIRKLLWWMNEPTNQSLLGGVEDPEVKIG